MIWSEQADTHHQSIPHDYNTGFREVCQTDIHSFNEYYFDSFNFEYINY